MPSIITRCVPKRVFRWTQSSHPSRWGCRCCPIPNWANLPLVYVLPVCTTHFLVDLCLVRKYTGIEYTPILYSRNPLSPTLQLSVFVLSMLSEGFYTMTCPNVGFSRESYLEWSSHLFHCDSSVRRSVVSPLTERSGFDVGEEGGKVRRFGKWQWWGMTLL